MQTRRVWLSYLALEYESATLQKIHQSIARTKMTIRVPSFHAYVIHAHFGAVSVSYMSELLLAAMKNLPWHQRVGCASQH